MTIYNPIRAAIRSPLARAISRRKLVTIINIPATGLPAISGIAGQGDLLSVGPGTIADADAFPTIAGYQWLRNGVAVPGATASTYTPTFEDGGSFISLRVSLQLFGGGSTTYESDPTYIKPYSPLSLFAAGEQGGWYDPTDVDRYMDVSQSPERVTNGSFDNGTANWSLIGGASFSVSAGIATVAFNNAAGGVFQDITVPSGAFVTIGVRCRRLSGGASSVFLWAVPRANFAGPNNQVEVTNSNWQTLTLQVRADATTVRVYLQAALSGAVLEVDDVSVREVTAISTATLFQDSAGTTPVTAVEQPVGLILDRRLGAMSALGVDQRSAGAVVVLGSSAAGSYDTSTGAGLVTRGATVNDQQWVRYSGLTANRTYLVTFNQVSGSIAIRPGSHSSLPFATVSGAGARSYVVPMGAETTLAITCATTNSTASFESISIREVPGNHLIQPTSASRPTYSKRYNLALSTEDLTTASWTASGLLSRALTGSATLPNGRVVPLTRCVENTANAAHRIQSAGTYVVVSGQEYVVSAIIKKGSRTWNYLRIDDAAASFLWFNADTGATGTVSAGLTSPSVVSLGDGAWLVSARRVASGTALQPMAGHGTADNAPIFTGDGVSFFDAGGVDVRRTIHTQMGMPAYQRVTTATDYDEAGFLPRLRFDGADDSMYSAASVDFSATDEMTVLAGLTKLSDVSTAIPFELSPDINANNGSFYVLAPDGPSTSSYQFRSRGTSFAVASYTNSAVAAPVSNVLTGLGDISSDVSILRLNGAQVASSAADQGTGNYGSYTLFIGRRNNTSFPFTGDIFQLIVRGALTSGANLTSAEQYVAQRTGVTL